MKNKRLTVILFHLLLAAVPAATLLTAALRPADTAPPELSAAPLLTGASAGQIDTFLTGNFPLREQLTSLRTRLELFSGRREVDGVFVLADRLIENTPAVSEKAVAAATERISAFADRFDGTVSLMLVPTPASIHRDQLPAYADAAPQKAVIDRAYELLSEKVGAIDCYSALSAGRDMSLYYRTDPRWTSLGAYMGYNACSSPMGFTPIAMDRFDIVHISHDFTGSLADRLGISLTPDTIDIYSTPGSNTNSMVIDIYNGEEWTQAAGLYAYDRLNEGYGIFPEADPFCMIQTGTAKAPRLLIIGDSHINALAPFLTTHYSTVALADLSLPESELRSLTDLGSYDQILFCCTLESFVGLQ